MEQDMELNQEQKEVIKNLSPLEQYIFYQGVGRGCLMALNSVMIRYVKCTLSQWRARKIKGKIQGIASVEDIVNMLSALFMESQRFVIAARNVAKKNETQEQENKNVNEQ